MGIKRSNERSPRGIVLFIVAIVIAMLAVGALALLWLLSTEYEATVLRGDEIQAGQLVQSGVELIALTIGAPASELPPSEAEFADAFHAVGPAESDALKMNAAARLYDNPDLFRGVEVAAAAWARPARGAGRFTVFSPRIERGLLRGIRFGLVNESSRLHLGAVLDWENEAPGQGARSLMRLPGMTPSIADSILDWIDPDKTPRPSGAELDYYERTGVPYRPRNAVPVTLEELLLVRDMRRRLLFGTDTSFSYGARMTDLQRARVEAEDAADLLFSAEPEPETGDQTTGFFAESSDEASDLVPDNSLPWCFLLTTLSAEKLVDPDGNAKFFLNAADLDFLETQLRRHLDDDAVDFLLTWRKNKGPIDLELDLLDAEVADTSTGRTLKSPFTLENAAGEDKFLKLLDYATVESSVVLSGRINVNEAPRLVLEAVPELSTTAVSQILGRRGGPGERNADGRPGGKFRHPVWLLSEKIVDKETMKKLSRRLTTGGDVYRAQVVGFFDGQGTVSRAEVVVDATVKPPRPIFSKDLTMFGSGL